MPVDTLVAKVGEEGLAADAVELIAGGKVQLVVNTPRGRGPRADGPHIRAAAVVHRVPCLTTLAAARAAAAGIADQVSHRLQVRTLQELQRRGGRVSRDVDLATAVGSVALANPVMTASGTAGHGAELAPYGDLGALGAVVVKSLSAGPWPGNPAPRVHEVPAGMLNSVGLQGPGVAAWLEEDLPALSATGAQVVVSIWGRSVEDYAAAAALLAGGRAGGGGGGQRQLPQCGGPVAHVRPLGPRPPPRRWRRPRPAACPRWVKLSPNVADLLDIAGGRAGGRGRGPDAGQHAARHGHRPRTPPPLAGRRRRRAVGPGRPPGGRAGGVGVPRGPSPTPRWSGWGGSSGRPEAVEFLMAGAQAVQVGTATFADPRAPWRTLQELARWCRRHRVASVHELIGAAHG